MVSPSFYLQCVTISLAVLLLCQHAWADDSLKFNKMDTHDKEHIKEHLDGMTKENTADMTDEELEFHYFKLHDYDNNNKLDGLEIALALKHHENTGAESENSQSMSEKEVIELIDSVLEDEDINNDGFVDYHEFVSAQRRTAEVPPPAPPQAPTAAPVPMT